MRNFEIAQCNLQIAQFHKLHTTAVSLYVIFDFMLPSSGINNV